MGKKNTLTSIKRKFRRSYNVDIYSSNAFKFSSDPPISQPAPSSSTEVHTPAKNVPQSDYLFNSSPPFNTDMNDILSLPTADISNRINTSILRSSIMNIGMSHIYISINLK